MEFQCLQKWLILKQECEWLQMASLIVLGQLLGAKDLWRGVECESQGSVKSCKKCGIGNALDGTEDNVLFQESVSSDSNIRDDGCDNRDEDFSRFCDW